VSFRCENRAGTESMLRGIGAQSSFHTVCKISAPTARPSPQFPYRALCDFD
jgi:hypothetical protein